MRRVGLINLLCIFALLVGSCAGDDGPEGPAGPPGGPGVPLPIMALFAGSEPTDTLQALAIDVFSMGLLPLGSVINVVDVTDSIPPLAFLNDYDAVLVWTTANVTDPVGLGSRLADYVDAGGGVVIGQMSFVNGAGLQGRIMSAGYSPLQSAVSVGVPFNRKIDFASVATPLHPILNGVNMLNFRFFSTSQWSNPGLASGATRVALDDTGANAIAINASGSVIGVNMSGHLTRGSYSEPPKLVVNSLLFVAGAF